MAHRLTVALCALALLFKPAAPLSEHLAAQSLSIGGVVVGLGDDRATTIAKLATRFTLDPVDSINYVVRERSTDGLALGSIGFWLGRLSVASREWHSGRNDQRALFTALAGALQSAGLQQDAVPIIATYESRQDPKGVIRIAKFTNGARTVSLYYNDQSNGDYSVGVTEAITSRGPPKLP